MSCSWRRNGKRSAAARDLSWVGRPCAQPGRPSLTCYVSGRSGRGPEGAGNALCAITRKEAVSPRPNRCAPGPGKSSVVFTRTRFCLRSADAARREGKDSFQAFRMYLMQTVRGPRLSPETARLNHRGGVCAILGGPLRSSGVVAPRQDGRRCHDAIAMLRSMPTIRAAPVPATGVDRRGGSGAKRAATATGRGGKRRVARRYSASA